MPRGQRPEGEVCPPYIPHALLWQGMPLTEKKASPATDEHGAVQLRPALLVSTAQQLTLILGDQRLASCAMQELLM